ncbi:MAG: PAS domain S-box protein, partial [Chitinophagales bacterium]|nr:PAS domain S-box protein [Chitinophagales bacterium]
MNNKITQQKKAEFDRLVEFEKNGTLSSLIIDSSELAIKTKTLKGVITSWNHGAEKIYGYKEVEIIGKNVSVLIPPNDHNQLHGLTKKISKGHIIPNHITKAIRKDGVIIDISISLSPIKDEQGNIIGVATLDSDITELVIANKELVFQKEEKEKRAAELVIANKDLVFHHEEKEKRAADLII